MRSEQRHQVRCRDVLRLAWIPVVQWSFFIGVALGASAAFAESADAPAETESQRVDSAVDASDEETESSSAAPAESGSEATPTAGAETHDEETDTEQQESQQDSAPAQQSEAATSNVESDPAIEIEPTDEDVADRNVKKTEPPIPPPKTEKKKKCVIGATATLLEKQSELLFRARVDSGAKSCSMHVEKMKIDGEAEKMVDNIGKVVQFQVKNGEDKAQWLKSKIAGYVIIKNSQSKERRYKVPMTFRWKHMEKEVLVTLSDRNHMDYPLLLGRNFLRGDFLVDVELDSDD